MSKFTGEPTNYLDLAVLVLCTCLYMYNVLVSKALILYDTYVYSLYEVQIICFFLLVTVLAIVYKLLYKIENQNSQGLCDIN